MVNHLPQDPEKVRAGQAGLVCISADEIAVLISKSIQFEVVLETAKKLTNKGCNIGKNCKHTTYSVQTDFSTRLVVVQAFACNSMVVL